MATYVVEPSILASDLCGWVWLANAAYTVEAASPEYAHEAGRERARAENVEFDRLIVWSVGPDGKKVAEIPL